MIRNIEIYFLLFFIYSILGWTMEVIRVLIHERKFVNRGFLIGPYCPIYGYGVLLLTFLLKKYQEDIVATFIFSILICGLLEYFTSYFMEKIFHARWWDYSKRKFNINGRICLETLIPFGIMGCAILYITNPVILNLLNKIPDLILHIVSVILFILYIIDNIVSGKIISKYRVWISFKLPFVPLMLPPRAKTEKPKTKTQIKAKKSLFVFLFKSY